MPPFNGVSKGLPVLLVWMTLSSSSAQVLSIAHRGGALYAPENTVAAFKQALPVTDLMETDVRVTSDGEFILMHDSTVDRTTDGTGPVASQTLAQLRLLDAGSWFSPTFVGERIPTLEEMITNTLPSVIPFIEVKAGTASNYVHEIRRLNMVTNVILQSFDWNFLAAVHVLEPDLRICALGSGTVSAASLVTLTNTTGARMISWANGNITSNEVSLAHAMNLAIYVWTVNSPSEIQRFKDMGVDGIVSDNPWTVRGVPPPIATNPPPPATELGDRLVAYWRMDDGLADVFAYQVTDSRGTNHALLQRPDRLSHWVTGGAAKLGGSLDVNGSGAYVILPVNMDLDINTNELTLSVWAWLTQMPSQLSTSYGAIFDSTADSYVLYLDRGNNELRFKVTDVNGQAARPGIPPALLRTNEWLHLAAVYNGNAGLAGQARMYLNGALVDTHYGNDSTAGAGLTGNVKSGQAASIGREGPSGGNYFTGMVDDLALWRRALSPAEIERLFAAGQSDLPLGDLLIPTTPLLRITSVRLTDEGANLEVRFQNLGTWSSFQLRQSTEPSGLFVPVPGLTPISLGEDYYQFDYPMAGEVAAFLRVEGQ
jgi:glycerophosphoryl diester phosphodiesterase